MEQKHFNTTHRLLHWGIALAIIILLGTALLHITWFAREYVARIIQENLLLFGIQISIGDAEIIAKRIAQPMWDWHFYAGYTLTALYVFRLLHLSFFGILFPNPLNNKNTLKQRMQGATYILFYTLLGVTIMTGTLMIWGPTAYRYTSQLIHFQSHYYTVAFILMHFGGIAATELFIEKGIASKMIHG